MRIYPESSFEPFPGVQGTESFIEEDYYRDEEYESSHDDY